MATLQSAASGNPTEAKRLFSRYTNGNIGRLYGPVNADSRGIILTALTGRCVPKSRAPWNVFRRAMLELYGVSGDCKAEGDANLRTAAAPVDHWTVRYGEMIQAAVDQAMRLYDRNFYQRLYLSYREAAGEQWGELRVSPAADPVLASPDPIPRNVDRAGLCRWVRNLADHLPIVGAE